MKPTLPTFELICRLAITFTIIAFLGCGSGSNSADNESTGQSATIAFQIKFNPPSNHALNLPVNHAIGEPNICNDYLIDKIGVQVCRTQDDSEVASADAGCAEHSLTVSNVPAGETLHLVCMGYVGSNPVWRGRIDDIVAVAGQNNDIGIIDMNYIGNDGIAPEVVSTFPATDAANVDLNSSIMVVFNEKLSPSTIPDQAIAVFSNGIPVSGQVGYDLAFNSIRFLPVNAFDPEKTYTATLQSQIEDGGTITDTAGNPFSGDVSWVFATRGSEDNTPPQVIATSPPSGATDVAPQTVISAAFSEPMDMASLTKSAFQLSSDQGTVSGQITYDSEYRILSFTPSSPLTPSMQYQVVLNASARDATGNPMAETYSWSFQTFSQVTHTITASAGTGGTITPSGGVAVAHQSQQVFQIKPNQGYYLAELIVDGTQVSPTLSYSFENVVQNHSIQAIFRVVRFVDNASVDPGGGDTWGTAFNTIQQAVDQASSGDDIWIKKGSYVLTASILVDKPLTIYGGFNGTEMLLEQRDSEANETIINGNQKVSCFRLVADNTRLDGITITNGYSDKGGGINSTADTYLVNCSVVSNTADLGGGVYTTKLLSIEKCDISNNWAVWSFGGGIYSTGSLLITNSTFLDNSATSNGAGIYSLNAALLRISDTLFTGNKALDGAAVYNDGTSTAAMQNCIFKSNSSDGIGGGIYNHNSALTVSGSRFESNNSLIGSGIYSNLDNSFFLSGIAVADSLFIDNSADMGSGLYIAAGPAIISNSIFYSNTAQTGAAGIHIKPEDPDTAMINLTIVDNSSDMDAGGVAANQGDSLYNCILWGNTNAEGPTSPAQISGSAYLTFCDIDQDSYAGANGNIRQPPMLTDVLKEDFHLQSGSHCRDAGTNAAPDLPEQDFEGDNRIIGGTVDIGADEYQP